MHKLLVQRYETLLNFADRTGVDNGLSFWPNTLFFYFVIILYKWYINTYTRISHACYFLLVWYRYFTHPISSRLTFTIKYMIHAWCPINSSEVTVPKDKCISQPHCTWLFVTYATVQSFLTNQSFRDWFTTPIKGWIFRNGGIQYVLTEVVNSHFGVCFGSECSR